ncbi:MAG: ribonuclease III [Gammaproteobacteria bacterium]|nr:ribonuclease III [Gammaproteobacteria bacterium]NND37961.1 ribonuclease III [Pseudomonadales bacterium]MBT8150235.1 ribonuclease III [Gammaproteobacteria bacterium]NNL11379.1 ribonuclease III [Pseudomonadales bacterium]NNM11825.1 ribonuclease III [Pseudomonadales bacterium]
MLSESGLDALQERVGHTFANVELLHQALRHRSAGSPDNERLEFLGDAILDAVVSEYLYLTYRDEAEGVLTTARAKLVRGDTLASLASNWQLHPVLVLGKGEQSGVDVRASILAAAVEAVIGAVYLDGGFASARRVILALMEQELQRIEPGERQKDAKTRLQEHTQKTLQVLPVYQVRDASGPAHQRYFRVSCSVQGVAGHTSGEAPSRRVAEQHAAELMLQKLGAKPADPDTST